MTATHSLSSLGIPKHFIRAWQAAGIKNLLPLQAEAAFHSALLRGRNLVIYSPTASGKTFLGEMAAARHLSCGRKAVFLCPTRALAEEQYAHFRRVYDSLGLRVVVATRERTLHDARIFRGDFDLAVMVYEKMNAFLALAPELMQAIGLVVADEIQIVSEPERGPVADMLLTRIAAFQPAVQIVGLTAVASENHSISAWLQADAILWEERPVELREGVFDASTGKFQYATSGSDKILEETFGATQDSAPAAQSHAAGSTGFHLPAVETLTSFLAARGEQVLIFVPTKLLSVNWALQLAKTCGLPPARECSAALWGHEQTIGRDALLETLTAGVAWHNADLPGELRSIVEDAFTAGEIRVLVATATLAQGVNLMCQNVISVPAMLAPATGTGRRPFLPLSISRFKNQGGRAGRHGNAVSFGRSILVADSPEQAAWLLANYVGKQPEPLRPAPACPRSLERFVLNEVHACGERTPGDVSEILRTTFTGRTLWMENSLELQRCVNGAVHSLERAVLLRRDERDELASTGLGEVAAAFGFSTHTMRLFQTYCRNVADGGAVDAFEAMLVCAAGTEGSMAPIRATRTEVARQEYPRRFSRGGGLKENFSVEPLRTLMSADTGVTAGFQHALKKAFACEAWLGPAATLQVEMSYGTSAGQLTRLASDMGWLLRGLAATMARLNPALSQAQMLETLARRLPLGLPVAAAALAPLQVFGMTRQRARLLADAGYRDAYDIAACQAEDLQGIVPENLAVTLREAAATYRAIHGEQRAAPLVSDERTANDDERRFTGPSCDVELMINASDIGVIWFRGNRIEVTARPFALAVLLAHNPGRTIPYAEIDEALWNGARVEIQQRSAHKRALVNAIAHSANLTIAEELITTVPAMGIRLNLSANQIRLVMQK